MNEEIVKFAEDELAKILTMMDMAGEVTRGDGDDRRAILRIGGNLNMGVLIGRDGSTLLALQTIVRAMVWKKFQQEYVIILDADGYLDKRNDNLRFSADRAVGQVERFGKKVVMEPMNSAERYFVHDYLGNNKMVKTYSVGEKRDRRLVVAPAGEESVAEPQAV